MHCGRRGWPGGLILGDGALVLQNTASSSPEFTALGPCCRQHLTATSRPAPEHIEGTRGIDERQREAGDPPAVSKQRSRGRNPVSHQGALASGEQPSHLGSSAQSPFRQAAWVARVRPLPHLPPRPSLQVHRGLLTARGAGVNNNTGAKAFPRPQRGDAGTRNRGPEGYAAGPGSQTAGLGFKPTWIWSLEEHPPGPHHL